MFTFNLVGN